MRINSASLLRLKALIKKELFQIIRDPSSILISLFLPLLLLFLYGYGVSLDLNHLKIGIVLEDISPEARRFAAAIEGSRYFDVKVGRHRSEFNEEFVSGKMRGIVIIPAYFSEFFRTPGNTAPIQVIADGSEPNTASFVSNYVNGVWQVWLEQERISQDLRGFSLVKFQNRYWYNEELESHNFLIPGSLAIIMTLIGTLLTALVIAREWERGTMEALMSTPVTIFEVIMGKLIPYYLLAMLSMTICMIFAVGFYHIPFRGSYLLLALTTTVFLFPALGLGLMISTLGRNQIIASQAAIFSAFLPAFILSGFIFEISSMPFPIQILTRFIPARYFVSNLQTLFLVGNVPELLIINMLWMLLLGSIFYIVVYFKTVKRLD